MIRPQLIPAAWARVCPLCFAHDDDAGLTEHELWRHLVAAHAAIDRVAAAAAELDPHLRNGRAR